MEQLRNRQNIHLRSEITTDAKFLALGITPLDSDHAECDGMLSLHNWIFNLLYVTKRHSVVSQVRSLKFISK